MSHTFVGKLRPDPILETVASILAQAKTFIHPKTGQPTQMKTGNIGSAQKPKPAPATLPAEPAWTPADIPAPASAPADQPVDEYDDDDLDDEGDVALFDPVKAERMAEIERVSGMAAMPPAEIDAGFWPSSTGRAVDRIEARPKPCFRTCVPCRDRGRRLGAPTYLDRLHPLQTSISAERCPDGQVTISPGRIRQSAGLSQQDRYFSCCRHLRHGAEPRLARGRPPVSSIPDRESRSLFGSASLPEI